MLPDIQASADDRGIEIDEVGIDNLRYPLSFADGDIRQDGIANFRVSVRLAADRRGTHMSRMVDFVDSQLRAFEPADLHRVSKFGADLLDASELRFHIAMPVALPVVAPASGRLSQHVHDVELDVIHAGGVTRLGTTVAAEITTLCPCSKAISDYGAHNQRSRTIVTVWGEGDDLYPVPLRQIAEVVRDSGSAPVIPMVKRPDERVLTMQAHDHPRFAEDVVRNASLKLQQRQVSHSVRVRNLESIHSHDAIARVTWIVGG